jgi:NAD(P)-dependent dehydrogenase (short-subunit alcohol dehydrogenase family)
VTGPVLVIGASGEVGEGIVSAFLDAGMEVTAAARSRDGLDAMAERLGYPGDLSLHTGSVANMDEAEDLAQAAGRFSSVVIAVNAPRQANRLNALSPDELAALIHADVLTHFIALRTFAPRLSRFGCFLGVGGGAADFVLTSGVYMSMAQAALRQLYRGFALEQGDRGPAIRELIVASVVAGRNHGQADPTWVTPVEIGRAAAAIVQAPSRHDGTIWRIGYRDRTGQPSFGREEDAQVKVLPL